jgi:uncharacterized membrane-anchored protein
MEDTTKIENDLEQARQDLHQTMAEVNQKVEEVGTRLQPESIVKRNPVAAACVAGALGYLAGSRGERIPILAALILGGLVAVVFKGSPDTDSGTQ